MIIRCRATGSMSASSPTTSIASRGLDRRTRPERIAAVLADDRRRHRRAAGGRRTRPDRTGACRGDRRGARHGLGDGPDARVPAASVRQRRAQPAIPFAITPSSTCRGRPASRATASASRSSSARAAAAGLQRAPRHRAPRAPLPGAAARGVGARPPYPGPKLVLGDFNEWGRGFVSDLLAERLKSIDLYPHLRRRRTYPGILPVPASGSHLLRGRHRRPPRRTAPLTPGAGRVGSLTARCRHSHKNRHWHQALALGTGNLLDSMIA